MFMMAINFVRRHNSWLGDSSGTLIVTPGATRSLFLPPTIKTITSAQLYENRIKLWKLLSSLDRSVKTELALFCHLERFLMNHAFYT